MLTVTAADLAAHDLLTPIRATLLARGVILRLADDGSVHVDGPVPAEVWAEADAAEAEARVAASEETRTRRRALAGVEGTSKKATAGCA